MEKGLLEKEKIKMELNKIYNNDSLNILKGMESNCVDMVLTSPPYDNLRKYNGYSFDFESIAKELYRVVKQGGVIVWIVNDATVKGSETGTSFKQALYFMKCGFNLHDTMIFAKNNPLPLTHNRYEQQFEYMFVFSKGKPKTFNPFKRENKNYNKTKTGTHRKTKDDLIKMTGEGKKVKKESIDYNIWFFSVNRGAISKDLTAHKHPAIFPYELAEKHIKSWTNEGDLVLDPFIGSGTTALACMDNGRNYIGVEISKEYCDLAIERISFNERKVANKD